MEKMEVNLKGKNIDSYEVNLKRVLCYHPHFQYTIDSSNKDIIFDINPLRE